MRLLTCFTEVHEISHVIHLIRAVIGMHSIVCCACRTASMCPAQGLLRETVSVNLAKSCELGIQFAAIKICIFLWEDSHLLCGQNLNWGHFKEKLKDFPPRSKCFSFYELSKCKFQNCTTLNFSKESLHYLLSFVSSPAL